MYEFKMFVPKGLPQVGRGRAAMLAQAASKDSFQGFAPQLASAL